MKNILLIPLRFKKQPKNQYFLRRIVIITFLTAIFSGCSSKDLYEVGQDYQKSKCLEESVSGKEHNDCLNAPQKPFEVYEKERKEVVNK